LKKCSNLVQKSSMQAHPCESGFLHRDLRLPESGFSRLQDSLPRWKLMMFPSPFQRRPQSCPNRVGDSAAPLAAPRSEYLLFSGSVKKGE
jgi:hypothetical protein